MKRPRWQIIAASFAAGLAALLLGFVLLVASQGAGQGEVGVILHGAFIAFGLIFALVFAAVALWLFLWHIKWLRWLGLAALVFGILAMVFGNQVRWWLIDQRIERSDRNYQAQVVIEGELYRLLRTLTQDQDAALAVLPTYMTRMNARDIHNGDYTNDWDTFAYVHTIYMFVVFGVERDAQYDNQRPPFAGLYCINFRDKLGTVVQTADQQERAEVACPDYL